MPWGKTLERRTIMKNRKGILFSWYAGFVLIALAVTLLASPSVWTAACEKKPAPQADEIRVTRMKDDITIEVRGPTKYIAKNVSVFRASENSGFCIIGIFADGSTHYVCEQSFGPAQSFTLRNVFCPISKREAKSFRGIIYQRSFALVKGPDAEPGEKLSLKGTFTWNGKDGEDFFFHEEGTGRVWKTVSSKKK